MLTYVFLFFEKNSMKKMVMKNLESHKMRNKMTSIIYSIALGFIIFLIVSYNLQMKTVELMAIQYEGAYLIVKTDNQKMITREQFDPILMQNSDLIEEFAYITPDVKNLATASFK